MYNFVDILLLVVSQNTAVNCFHCNIRFTQTTTISIILGTNYLPYLSCWFIVVYCRYISGHKDTCYFGYSLGFAKWCRTTRVFGNQANQQLGLIR